MRYLTDRKRAAGLGSAKEGTHHFWSMMVSSYALIILVPLFVFTLGPIIGEPHGVVVDYYSRPFPAIVAGLTLVVGLNHFQNGAQIAIEDYVGGYKRKISIIAAKCLAYAIMATGLFALAKMAL